MRRTCSKTHPHPLPRQPLIHSVLPEVITSCAGSITAVGRHPHSRPVSRPCPAFPVASGIPRPPLLSHPRRRPFPPIPVPHSSPIPMRIHSWSMDSGPAARIRSDSPDPFLLLLHHSPLQTSIRTGKDPHRTSPVLNVSPNFRPNGSFVPEKYKRLSEFLIEMNTCSVFSW